MEKSLNDSLRDEIINCLSSDYPTLIQDLSDEDLNMRVTNGISRAKKYDLRRKVDITSFVILMFNIAPNFDLYAEVLKTLNDSTIPTHLRLDFIIENITDNQWEEMRSRYQSAAWTENFE